MITPTENGVKPESYVRVLELAHCNQPGVKGGKLSDQQHLHLYLHLQLHLHLHLHADALKSMTHFGLGIVLSTRRVVAKIELQSSK